MTKLEQLQAFLPDDRAAALVTGSVNRRYLSGFASSAGAVLVTKRRALLLVDFRYYEAAVNAVRPPLEVIRTDRLTDEANRIFLKENIDSVYIEDGTVTLAQRREIAATLVPALIEEGLSDKLAELRMIKTPDEVERIVRAQRITERAYSEVLNYLRPGVTERAIAVELEHLIKRYGGERIAFDLICITGANTSLPHGVPGERVVSEGDFFTFDIGSVYEGWHSDMTRTVAVGAASDEMRAVYDTVLQAHRSAERAIRAGSTAGEVDLAARSLIDSRGYGEYFGHSTGHGVSRRSGTVLRDGMVITDEPGIYLPGRFGVRIEDMYLVSGDTPVDLAQADKELVIV